jgi:hypothetical protein
VSDKKVADRGLHMPLQFLRFGRGVDSEHVAEGQPPDHAEEPRRRQMRFGNIEQPLSVQSGHEFGRLPLVLFSGRVRSYTGVWVRWWLAD